MNDKKIILYRPQQICKLLSISYPTFLKYIKNDSLKAIRVGGQWRVNRTELERFIKEGNFNEAINLEDIEI